MRTSAAVVAVVASLALTGCGSADRPGRTVDLGGPDEQPGRGQRPNIVVVMADDMRADDLRFMPRLQRLVADRGLAYRNSFSPYPLCCPARASFLTGQYPHNHRILSNDEPWGFGAFDDRSTIATSLRRAGYRTGFIGKYLNNYGAVPSSVTGRPSWHYVPAGWTDWMGLLQRPAGSPYPSGGTYDYFHPILNVNGRTDDTHQGEYQTEVVGRFARSLVRRYSASRKPFFLYLSALAPHTGLPREADDVDRVRRYDGEVTELPSPARPDWVKGHFDDWLTRSPGIPADGTPIEADLSDKPRTVHLSPLDDAERAAETLLARQRAEALYALDREVARLVGTLRSTGSLRNTVLMFTSDNGYFLGEHRRRSGKILAYEPALRVPFLIAGPGVGHGERFDPVKTPDLAATILDLADATPPHRADGISLVDNIRHGDRGWSVPVLTEALVVRALGGDATERRSRGFTDARTAIGVRTARYKLVRWATGAVELYDLTVDPNELRNVAHERRYRDVRRELEAVWWRYKDCRGVACSRPLPPALRTAPGPLAAMSGAQARGVRNRFGVSWIPLASTP